MLSVKAGFPMPCLSGIQSPSVGKTITIACSKKIPNFSEITRFLCEGSYGVGHALEPISDSSLHPVYGGEQCYIWDAVKKMGAKKVFILFGLNDISIWGVQGTADNYARVHFEYSPQKAPKRRFTLSVQCICSKAASAKS